MSAVLFEGLSKTYKTRSGEIQALESLSFEIPEGHIFGFAGPNGAGKSTAIKILVGLTRATAGRAEIFSHPCGSLEARKLLGFLPEVTLYHEFMGAAELLAVHAKLAKVPSSERAERCENALKTVDLWERRKSRLGEFSKGMKQRFGIAQALVGNPKLLVLDELTSGLDPHAQSSLLSLLEDLRNQGLTIFFSSHHLEEIERVCDSAAIIHKGVLRSCGTIDEILGDQRRVKVTLRCEEALPEAVPGEWRSLAGGLHVSVLEQDQASEILSAIQETSVELVSFENRRRTLAELFHQETQGDEKTEAVL